MIIKTKIVRWFGAGAITVYPFIFMHPDHIDNDGLLTHEMVHYHSQRCWCLRGLGIGLLVWFWLYLIGLPLGLPFGWNPWRRRWETDAFKAQGYDPLFIEDILKRRPYYLWWT